MIEVDCDKCGKEVEGMGGLMFSPPFRELGFQRANITHKYHLCKDCWPKMLDWLYGREVIAKKRIHEHSRPERPRVKRKINGAKAKVTKSVKVPIRYDGSAGYFG